MIEDETDEISAGSDITTEMISYDNISISPKYLFKEEFKKLGDMLMKFMSIYVSIANIKDEALIEELKTVI